MPYVQRIDGKIAGVFATEQDFAKEFLPENSPELAAEKAKHDKVIADADVKQSLAKLDFQSIRGLREYIASQTGAPQEIKDKEAQAVAEREKLNQQ